MTSEGMEILEVVVLWKLYALLFMSLWFPKVLGFLCFAHLTMLVSKVLLAYYLFSLHLWESIKEFCHIPRQTKQDWNTWSIKLLKYFMTSKGIFLSTVLITMKVMKDNDNNKTSVSSFFLLKVSSYFINQLLRNCNTTIPNIYNSFCYF